MIKIVKYKEGIIELTYDEYVKRGNIQYLREGLPLDDPDLLYTYLKNSSVLIEAHYTPEDFNIFHPITEKYKYMSTEELLKVITELSIKNQSKQWSTAE